MKHLRYTPDAKPVAMATPTGGHTFMCGRCNTPRLVTGRKVHKVRGLKCYVCAECAAAHPQPKVAP